MWKLTKDGLYSVKSSYDILEVGVVVGERGSPFL